MLFTCDISRISEAVDYIREELKKRKIRSAEISKTALTTEEVIRTMIAHAGSPEERLSVRVTALTGSTGIRIACRGTAFQTEDVRSSLLMDDDPETDGILRSMANRILGNRLSIRHRNGVNHATIQVAASRYKRLALTLGSLAAGLIAGVIMRKVLPAGTNAAIADNLFTPISTMFLNALKMVVGPLVLFSIASSIAEFSDIRALGRVAAKTMTGYCITSVIAILLGTAVWFLFPIGDPALQQAVTSAGASVTEKAQGASVSLIDTIVNIVPKDVVQPFLSEDMLQIIFIAMMTGLAAGALSNKLHSFKNILNDCNLVFSRITGMIISVMPVAIFCNMAKLMQSMQLSGLSSVLVWIPVIYFGQILMLLVYSIIIRVFCRENPLTFFRKFYPVMLTGYSFGSSNATLPTSMEVCGKKLGISKKIYAFSLPLGATVNMDGSCIALMISALFMAKIFGVQVSLSMMLMLFLSVFVLSLGSPGVPGGTLVCISILLPQIGVPAEAISIVMGLYTVVGMSIACINVTGDAVITLYTAKTEKMLDLEVLRSKDKT